MKREKLRKVGILSALLCLCALLAPRVRAQEPPAVRKEKEDDVIMKALSDELARSMGRLQLENLAKPYYVAYEVTDTSHYAVAASFGALTSEGEGPGRGLSVEVRVGDYKLDNTNFGGGGYYYGGMGGFFGGGGFGLDDEYDAFRQDIWLRTDGEYKEALETITKKKAFLENKKIEDRPDDFSREEPVVLIEPLKKLEVNKDRWKATCKKLSGLFRDYPDIQGSGVMFMASAQNHYLLSSEGFKQRVGQTMNGLIISAASQCEDGMPLSNFVVFGGRNESDFPADEQLLKAVKEMADKLVAVRKSAKAEDYTGPVMFEGQAAAEFFLQTLSRSLGAVRESDREGGYGFSMGGGGVKLNDKIGKPILSGFISVFDDPTVATYNGKPLLGAYAVDDDGVRAQKVALIENGKLLTLLSSRVPTKEIKKSNGHSRGRRPGIGNLFVQSSKSVSLAELKAKLIEAAKDAGLEYGLLVRKLSNPMAAMAGGGRGGSRFDFGDYEPGQIPISEPVEIYKVYVADGREELMRGAKFGGASLRTFRDIMVTGDDTNVYNAMEFGGTASVVAPSILIKELDLKKPPEKFDKPPILKNAFFEK